MVTLSVQHAHISLWALIHGINEESLEETCHTDPYFGNNQLVPTLLHSSLWNSVKDVNAQ